MSHDPAGIELRSGIFSYNILPATTVLEILCLSYSHGFKWSGYVRMIGIVALNWGKSSDKMGVVVVFHSDNGTGKHCL